jgi:hypothetical protein
LYQPKKKLRIAATLMILSSRADHEDISNRTRKMENFWERFYMAAFGGIALVGPMLIMVLHRGKATSLVTVSVSVLLFAIIISKYSTGTPEAVLGIVAAYAAVLVVFVGTSS